MSLLDTYLYDLSIPVISKLQHGQLSGHSDSMQLISTIFDPKYAFLIYSPIVFLLDRKIGKQLILTTVMAEWLNQILKWLLHGERPYWYVHSSGHFDAQQVPIEQFPSTCELGPGHPSGHAMVTAALWFIMLNSAHHLYTKFYGTIDAQYQEDGPAKAASTKPAKAMTTTTAITTTRTTGASSSIAGQLTSWSLYLAILAAVSVSRVFLGCHFPHQCLAGALLGYLLAKFASKLDINGYHFVGASAVLFASAFATYGLLLALGVDPSWTITLATKHCIKREYIHLDTAPFFSIMRYCGMALGTGLGLLKPVTGSETKLNLSVRMLMALLLSRLVDNMPVYYPTAFLGYTGFAYAIINL